MSSIQIRKVSITKVGTSAIVNAANEQLMQGGGVCGYIFEAAGADLLDISGGLNGFNRPGLTEPGYFKDLSLAAGSAVSVPVILTGGVTDGKQAEQLLKEGAADMIGIGRALLSDPDWSLKALSEAADRE